MVGVHHHVSCVRNQLCFFSSGNDEHHFHSLPPSLDLLVVRRDVLGAKVG